MNRTTTENLQAAIDSRVAKYLEAINWIRERDDDGIYCSALREAVELCRILRRVVPHLSLNQIYQAFGAPGDFGYETAIGDALATLYRGSDVTP
jgi:hypothetical protein